MQILKRLTVLIILAGAFSFGLMTFFADDAMSLVLCPPPKFDCLDVWDPVICDGGVIYSNACYAARACATGCVPYGGATQ